MSHYPLHKIETAPAEAKPMLEAAKKNLGVIPNLEKVMASAPPLLEGYVKLWDLFDTTSLTPIERQVVYQTANFENNCEYCVPWHTHLSKLAKMPEDVIESLRQGKPIEDSKLAALQAFTKEMVVTRGDPSAEVVDEFHKQGYTQQNALEVVLGLATKLMSNYTNHIAGTPLDAPMEKYKWEKPE